jgi:ribosomal protein S18 acetylase RimI-like enzyme
MDEITIRRLRKEDAEDIGRIDASIKKARSKLDFKRIVEEEVERAVDASYVAIHRGKVVGYMISYVTSGNFGADKCAWIAMFGVDPKIMGQGIGQRLAEEIFKFHKSKGIKELLTSVRWDSTDILSFFKTLGFERSNFINLRKPLA